MAREWQLSLSPPNVYGNKAIVDVYLLRSVGHDHLTAGRTILNSRTSHEYHHHPCYE